QRVRVPAPRRGARDAPYPPGGEGRRLAAVRLRDAFRATSLHEGPGRERCRAGGRAWLAVDADGATTRARPPRQGPDGATKRSTRWSEESRADDPRPRRQA